MHVCVCVCVQQDRVQVNNGALTISSLNLADIGMYQCVAENKHGRIFTNAELRVIGKTKTLETLLIPRNPLSGVKLQAVSLRPHSDWQNICYKCQQLFFAK